MNTSSFPNIAEYLAIHNFLPTDVCDKYIDIIDGLFSQEEDDGLELEGYQRLRITNTELAYLVETLLSKQFDTRNIRINTKWFPTKYVRDGSLGTHIDGHAYDDAGNPSTYTILIYLNDDYDGGRTVFVDDYDTDEIILPTSRYVKPTKGLLIILRQDVLHFAEKITYGVKYILRSDIFVYPKDAMNIKYQYEYII